VGFELFATANAWSFGIDGQEVRVPFQPRMVVNTAEAAIDAAIAGAREAH
jgi:hypothetical protein